MRQCYERLVERAVQPDDARTILAFAERILDHPIELIHGVQPTLEELSMRHDLALFTKGHPEEQKLKLERSGLAIYFGRTAIVKEKDTEAYRELVAGYGFDIEKSWMIGNSPKSDINPALEAGLHAVYVPHERTWHLEKTDLAENAGRLIVIEKFADLLLYF
jgi:putative hydrolase of the HAD superfamily